MNETITNVIIKACSEEEWHWEQRAATGLYFTDLYFKNNINGELIRIRIDMKKGFVFLTCGMGVNLHDPDSLDKLKDLLKECREHPKCYECKHKITLTIKLPFRYELRIL